MAAEELQFPWRLKVVTISMVLDVIWGMSVYDDSSIMADLASGQYDDYEMPMMTEDDNPWALAVPLDELNGIWGNFMSGMIVNWHASGRLIELEKKWGIQSTQFVIDMNKRFAPYAAN